MAEARDSFEIVIDPAAAVYWPEGGGFQPAEVRINGRSLIEMVRAAEVPWAQAENAERTPDPDSFSGPVTPGAYLYPSARSIQLPSREWLGEPSEPGFVLDADDPRRGKAMVLGCTCGISECWFVQARIEVSPDVVQWSDFGQFHRPEWVYGLGPFTFDRRLYEEQLTPRDAQVRVAQHEVMQVPTHLIGLAVPEDTPTEQHLAARLRCPCGEDRFSLLYHGTTHEHEGHPVPCTGLFDGHPFFVLRVRCVACDRDHLLFDDHFHGWNGFVCHLPELAARPRPRLVAWRCEKCGETTHRGTVGIAGEGRRDFAENAPHLPPGRWPDGFGWFTVDIECCTCGYRPDVWVSFETM